MNRRLYMSFCVGRKELLWPRQSEELQLTYKVVWFMGVVFPLLVSGVFPAYAVLHVVIFATYIIGDLMAIPFSYVFAKEPS